MSDDNYYGVIIRPFVDGSDDVLGAVIHGGHIVAEHVSSNEPWAQIDLKRHIPEGRDLVWLGGDRYNWPEACPGCDECRKDEQA